jgi:hypothetical protein
VVTVIAVAGEAGTAAVVADAAKAPGTVGEVISQICPPTLRDDMTDL